MLGFPLRALPLLGIFTASTLAGCGASSEDAAAASSDDALHVVSSFTARGTGYYPDSSALEGGFVDRRGVRLRTLQQFLSGEATYVSVAMDATAFPYGQRLRIHELEAKYGRAIPFRVVDTGGAFRGKGRSRIDVCTASRSASLDPTINGALHIDVISDSGGDDADPTPTAPPADDATCASDGDCNPGNDGSGLVCSGGQCVPGCHASWMCPGSTSCVDGQCR